MYYNFLYIKNTQQMSTEKNNSSKINWALVTHVKFSRNYQEKINYEFESRMNLNTLSLLCKNDFVRPKSGESTSVRLLVRPLLQLPRNVLGAALFPKKCQTHKLKGYYISNFPGEANQ